MYDDDYWEKMKGCIVILVFLLVAVLIFASAGDAILNMK